MDFDIRELAPFQMLGVAGGFDGIAELWDRIGEAIEPGGLVSSDPRVEAYAAEFRWGDAVVYAAGVPCEPGASHPGLELFEVPGGRYALVTHHGAFGEMPALSRALARALEAAGHSPTEHWVELYYPDDEKGRHHVEMGVLVGAS